MTMDTYSHVLPTMQARAMSRLNDVLLDQSNDDEGVEDDWFEDDDWIEDDDEEFEE